MMSRSVLLADRRRQLLATALVALGALLAPGRATAQASEALELHWDAPGSCPSERRVRDRIRKLAGSSRSTEPRVQADATITRSVDGRLHLELVVRVRDLVGTRRIEGRSCEDLAGAAAVALALLLRSPVPLGKEDLVGREANETAPADGNPADEQLEKAREADAGTEKSPKLSTAPPEPVRSPVRSSMDEPPSVRRWHALLEAPLAAFGLGPLPEPNFGVAVAGGASFDRWRFLFEGSAWRTQRMTAGDEPGVGADVQLFAAGLRPCWAILQGQIDFAPCLTLTVEHVRASGTGDHIVSRTAEATWIAAGVGAHARWRIASWFALIGRVNGQIEASRPRITIDGVGALGQTWPAAMALALGPEWIF